METRTIHEAQENVAAFATRILQKMVEKKGIDDEIKAIKQEFKEEGVPVGVVTREIANIKKAMKQTESEIFEGETINEWLNKDSKVVGLVEQLVD